MQLPDIKTARDEALRFIDRAERLIKAEEVALQEQERRKENGETFYWVSRPLEGSKLSGAVKRSSMDLTRALADMRNPYRNENT